MFLISNVGLHIGCTPTTASPLVSALERKYSQKSNLIPVQHPTANKVSSEISEKRVPITQTWYRVMNFGTEFGYPVPATRPLVLTDKPTQESLANANVKRATAVYV